MLSMFSEISIEQQNGNQYIKALYKGKSQVYEKIFHLMLSGLRKATFH